MTQIKIDDDLVQRFMERFCEQEPGGPPLTKLTIGKRLGQWTNQHLRDTKLKATSPFEDLPKYLPKNVMAMINDAPTNNFSAVARKLRDEGWDPELVKPNPDYKDDPQYIHLENKKTWIRENWPFEGMRDPAAAKSFAMKDIASDTRWDDLTDAAQTAYRVAFNRYSSWKLKNPVNQ